MSFSYVKNFVVFFCCRRKLTQTAELIQQKTGEALEEVIPMVVQRIAELVQKTEAQAERLILVVGQPGSGKSKIMRDLSATHGWEYVDSCALITEELLELMPNDRAKQAVQIMDGILEKLTTEVIVLDGIQVLFAPVLHIDPLQLLQTLSRRHTLVVAWPGKIENAKLIFNQDGRIPYREYDAQTLRFVEIV